MKDKISITINEKVLRDIDSLVDNIYIRNRSQAIEHLIKKALKESRIAVILADNKPSPKRVKNRFALKINGSTLIEKALRKLSDSGFKQVYIIADHDTLTKIFQLAGDGFDYGLKIEFVNEENQEGTASALKLLKGIVKTTFLVIQSDLILDYVDLNELWQQHLQEKNTATIRICSSSIPNQHILFGVVKLKGNKVVSYDEKPLPSRANSSIFFGGVFASEPEILSYPGKSLEFDIFPELTRKGILGGRMSSSEHLHIHTYEDLARVKEIIKKVK